MSVELAPRVVVSGPLVIDMDRWCVAVDGLPVYLPQRQRDLLVVLARHAGRVVSYERIIRDVWDTRRTPRSYATLIMTLKRLRQTLEQAGARVATVAGHGLMLLSEDAL